MSPRDASESPSMNITARFARNTIATAIVLAGALAAVGGVDAKGTGSGGGTATGGGDAPQNVYMPANCTIADTGFVLYNKSGSRVTFAFGAHHDASTAGWSVNVTDAGQTLVDATVPALGSDWTLVRNYTSPKGQRTIVVTAKALDGSNACTASLSYKA